MWLPTHPGNFACHVTVRTSAHPPERPTAPEGNQYKLSFYILPIGFIRELQQSLKIQAMGFNKQNITMHVHDDARFSVGFLYCCCTKSPDGKFFFWQATTN